MINLNSPTVQSMLANVPSGGLGNMPVGYGNPPTVETVSIPSPHMVPISPYPDPYNMITGAGLTNYMQMPTYNFTGALSSNPLMTPNGAPTYRDMNQPVMGTGLPIGNYYNPYMTSFTGMPYGNNGMIGFTPGQERYYRYMYASPEDRQAMDMGFESMAEMKSNEISILSKLSIMAKNALGADKSEIDAIKEQAAEQIAKIEKDEKEKPSSYNPFDLRRYQTREEPTTVVIQAKIIKGGEIICEIGADGRRSRSSFNELETIDVQRKVSVGMRVVEKAQELAATKYANAPEREVDNMGLIDFFNKGFGLIHYHDRLEQLKVNHNVTRLFDSAEFRRKLQMEYGSPQMKRRIALEDARNFRTREQEEQDLKNGMIRGTYGRFPTGEPLSEGTDPNIGSCISFNVNDGGIYITAPPEMSELDRPLLKGIGQYEKTVSDARDRFIRSIGT